MTETNEHPMLFKPWVLVYTFSEEVQDARSRS